MSPWKDRIATALALGAAISAVLAWLWLLSGCATTLGPEPDLQVGLQNNLKAVLRPQVDLAPSVGGNGDSVALWLAIGALAGLPVAYPLGRAARKRLGRNQEHRKKEAAPKGGPPK